MFTKNICKIIEQSVNKFTLQKGYLWIRSMWKYRILAQFSVLHYSIHIHHNFETWKSYLDNVFCQFQQLGTNCRFVITKSQQPIRAKVVNSREVREVVEGTTCISDKKLSEIC